MLFDSLFSINEQQKAKAWSDFFKPPKQKSQTSLVFGMDALVPLGTIKTL
ncbi:hypothetical protein HpHA181_15190 [Helicobacter pylori]